MRIIIQGKATIEDPPKDVVRPIKKLLTIKNPAIAKKLNMNLSVFGIESELNFYEEKGNKLIVPVGSLGKVIGVIEEQGHKLTPLHLLDMRTATVDKEYFSRFKFNGKLRDYQKPIGDAKEGNTVGVIQAKTGSGKCLGKDTPVLMYDGSIKKVQDIGEGEALMGPDSKPRKVISTTKGREKMYKVNPVKGNSWTCNESHILSLIYMGNTTKKITSRDIVNMSVKEFLSKNKTFRRNCKLYRTGIKFPHKEVELDPYLLGLWLGDGTSRQPHITNPDKEIIRWLEVFCDKSGLELSTKNPEDRCINHRLNDPESGGSGNFNRIQLLLKNLNLLLNKHIPKEYLYNSEEIRHKVLAGLLDTDGHMQNSGYEICTKYEQLNEDILYLCRSLGLAAYSSIKEVQTDSGLKSYHRISISGDTHKIPCIVERKKASKRAQIKDVLHTGFTLEDLGTGEYFGFEIDGDRLFLLGDFTVTHNTVIFTEWVLRGKANTMILVNTKELAEQTIEALVEFSNLTREDIGFIGSGRFEMKPISIGILQTITKLKGEEHQKVKEYFGQVVADETHIIAAETYFEAMGKLPARFKWGYSATPEREDGLTDVIFWATGPLIYKVPDEAVAHKLIIPTYRQVKTDYYFPLVDTSEYQTMISYMAIDKDRNQLIVDEFMKKPDSPSVFLCNRTDQVEALHEMIPDSIMLTSKMSKKKREAAMADLRSGKKKHVSSTWGLFSTGINVPKLEGLYICSPMKSKNKLKQAAGRLMRQAPGKEESFIVDFIDTQIGLLYGQSRTRKRILNDL